MNWIAIVITLIILAPLILAWFGMWISNSDKKTDEELYGMDAEEYLKYQAGEEYYNKHYKP